MAYDFDTWAALARNDPEGFEAKRQELIEAAIQNRFGCERRLRGLQFRIDLERDKARTPLKACLRLSSLMWDSFADLREGLERLGEGRRRNYSSLGRRDGASAEILPFRKD